MPEIVFSMVCGSCRDVSAILSSIKYTNLFLKLFYRFSIREIFKLFFLLNFTLEGIKIEIAPVV